uniref:Universal stress protein n=3 Tax=Schistosoma japonicum TaxID=6182 RepID=C1LMW5_SCHJA|nr:Universal stress protein [Schistosoma japonicum]CAX70904.1 Universal stress protein [Schistosoma japonicum]CAX70907.1 Universal stress protein [Schistosoma japonicum]CAX76043.1 Universal stress protein [Schistosoma japonicum]
MVNESEYSRVILIPIDGSDHCDRAFRWYLENMKRDTDCIKFVHVVEPAYNIPTTGLTMDLSPVPDMTQALEASIASGKKLGQKYIHEAKSYKLSAHAFLHVDTKPGSSLVKAISEHKADVILMGSRGLGAIRRTFLGSVSDYVLHHAHIPVVIIPPQDKQ